MLMNRINSIVPVGIFAFVFVLNSPAASRGEDSVESKFLSNIRQVTNGFEKAGEGYFSPDGKSIIYQAIRREYPFYQIYTQPLDGGRPKLISTGRGRTTCSFFHPSQDRLLFASSHEAPNLYETEEEVRLQEAEDRRTGKHRRYSWPFDPYSDIYETDRNGKILRKLTDEPGYDAEGAWSSDGKLIAYCHDDGTAEKPDPNIWLMNGDGSNKRQITTAPGYDGGPFISPDGKWIVFRSDREQAEHLQIYVIGIDGKNETRLTTEKADDVSVHWGPYWHPTKPYIIWAGADHSNPRERPNYDLWMTKYEVKDGKFTTVGPRYRVTDNPGADVLPVFSPDGKKLMWTSTRTDDHSSQLFIADFKLPE